MHIVPLDDRVLVKRIEKKEERIGSIIVPDTAREKPSLGEVLAVGNDEGLQALLKKGDRVLFGKYSGSDFDLEGDTFLILQRNEIVGKLVD
jgi:chaperonin GroES